MANNDHHKHFVGQVAQKALITKDGNILLVKYPQDDRVGEVWDLPGGRFHDDEPTLEGLKREVREEIGAEINVAGPIATGTFDFVLKNRERTPKLYFVVYSVALVDPEQTLIPEEGEIAEIAWFKPAEFFTLDILHRDEYIEALKPFLV